MFRSGRYRIKLFDSFGNLGGVWLLADGGTHDWKWINACIYRQHSKIQRCRRAEVKVQRILWSNYLGHHLSLVGMSCARKPWFFFIIHFDWHDAPRKPKVTRKTLSIFGDPNARRLVWRTAPVNENTSQTKPNNALNRLEPHFGVSVHYSYLSNRYRVANTPDSF